MRECQYRNCYKGIVTGRPNKKYCCVKHKRNEAKYRQREKNNKSDDFNEKSGNNIQS